MSFIFTSESVTEGHPDKVADQISDAILDACLAQDPHARVACEALVKGHRVVLAGELHTDARLDLDALVRETVANIGYTDPALGFAADSLEIINLLSEQSREIRHGVERTGRRAVGAGDQGLMFGYATDETEERIPAPIFLAHKLARRLAEVRRSGVVEGLRPDGKVQVSIRYEGGVPAAVDTVLISAQHDPELSVEQLQSALWDQVIQPVLAGDWITPNTRVLINPCGTFVTGGPVADCGLTGRKIIVDTYGGMARHGGGAFSGKDPSKVDRSAAYAARWVARSLIDAGLARRCEVQLAYAIGVAEPVSIYVNSYGTGAIPDRGLERWVSSHFDLSPAGIIEALRLERPIYRQTASYGHFGRSDLELPWEQPIASQVAIKEQEVRHA